MNHLSRDSLIASNKQKAASVSIKRCIVGKVASLSLAQGCGMLFCFFVCLFESSHFIYFTIEGKNCFIMLLVSPVQHKSKISYVYTHIPSKSWASPALPAHHSGHHRAPSWAELPVPCSRYPLAISFYTWRCIWYAFRFRLSSPYSRLVPSYRCII